VVPVDVIGRDVVERFHERPCYRKDERRWGNACAKILDWSIVVDGKAFPPSIRAGSTVRVAMKVWFVVPVERPMFGLLLKTHDGVFLHGTNSKLCGDVAAARPARAGEVRVGEFEFRCALNAGPYLLSLGVSDEGVDGELTPLDRRYDSILFVVDHPKPFWGIADMDSRFALIDVE
jgi:lipopolysaccharide transport system ATP-binding protein